VVLRGGVHARIGADRRRASIAAGYAFIRGETIRLGQLLGDQKPVLRVGYNDRAAE